MYLYCEFMNIENFTLYLLYVFNLNNGLSSNHKTPRESRSRGGWKEYILNKKVLHLNKISFPDVWKGHFPVYCLQNLKRTVYQG